MSDTTSKELSIRQRIVNCFNGDDSVPPRAIDNLEALIIQERIDEASLLPSLNHTQNMSLASRHKIYRYINRRKDELTALKDKEQA